MTKPIKFIRYQQTTGFNPSSKTFLPLPSLTRSNFNRINLKGLGDRYYFSFINPAVNLEICLEPCANGFCIGAYEHGRDNLMFPKKCTGLESDVYKNEGDTFEREIRGGTLERSEKAWDSALVIANQFYRIIKNEKTLRDWKLVPASIPESPNPDSLPPYSPPLPHPYSPPLPYPYNPFMGTTSQGKIDPSDLAHSINQDDINSRVYPSWLPRSPMRPDRGGTRFYNPLEN